MNTKPFSKDDVEIIKRETVYQGYFAMEKLQLRHRLFAGNWSHTLVREVFIRGLAVAALLYDPQRDEVVMLEQFRAGALTDPRSPWLIELVAGIMEKDEVIQDVVQREIQEETGLVALDMEAICEYWVSPGCSTERVALYCVRVDASKAGGLHGLAIEGEDIRVEAMSFAKAYGLIAKGIITNAPTIIALQWLQLHHKHLLSQWSVNV